MKNIFEIKDKPQNTYILSKEHAEQGYIFAVNCVVVIHLYYADTIENYIGYIKNIPDEIDVIITYTDQDTMNLVKEGIGPVKKNCKFVYKKNRGRDISALLVACRDEILKYDYVCFIHDKKEKTLTKKKDTEDWNYLLWENTLASKEYIYNVILTFHKNPNLGCLTPPIHLSDRCGHLYLDEWGENREHILKLLARLCVNSNIVWEESPITLGTVFWAKVDALKKLLNIEWKYEDFDEEPLRDDGTISHAIERILALVAQDAGYDTAWIMTDLYASQYIEMMKVSLKKTYDVLNENYGITTLVELDAFNLEGQQLKAFCDMHQETYVYGKGVYATKCFKILKSVGAVINGFIVSEKKCTDESFFGYPVLQKEEIRFRKEMGIIVAVGAKYQEEILSNLHMLKIKESDICIFRKE